MSKTIRFGLVLAVLMSAAALASCDKSASSAVPEGDNAAANAKITIRPDDIIRGNPNAPVTMVEYASMTCPHCARWEKDVMPKLVDNYIKTGKVRYIFREFPLDGAARMASALARCQKGDSFYSFIDLLFLNQTQWVKDFNGDNQLSQEDVLQGLTQMGRMAGLSQEQVQTCSNDPKNLAVVDANWQEAQTQYNVQSTPNFILGDEVHRGEWAWDELDAKLKKMLAAHH